MPARRSAACGRWTGPPELIELIDDSLGTVSLESERSAMRCSAAAARSASSRRVAPSSSLVRCCGVCSISRDKGKKAGVSSSSSSSSRRPARCVENFPKRLNLGALRLDSSSSSDTDSSELDVISSSSNGGDRRNEAVGGWSRLLVDGRRTRLSHRWSLPSAVGV